MNKLLIKQFEGSHVEFTSDGWLNLTSTAKRFNKKAGDWLRNISTQEYIEELATALNTEAGNLVTVNKGFSEQGTFAHPDLAVVFARWCSPKFAIWCDQQIKNILKGEFEPRPQNNFTQLDLIQGMIDFMRAQDKRIETLETQVKTIESKPASTQVIIAKAKQYKTIRKETLMEQYRRPIADLVIKTFQYAGGFKDRWDMARHEYKMATGDTFPAVDRANEEQLSDFLNWIKKLNA